MRLWTLALVFVAAVSYCEAKTVEELKAWADEAEAPFTTVALERLENSELWGANRAGRSLDVVIINKSGISFKLTKSGCRLDRGSPSSGLSAESNLYGQTSTVLGFQSSDDDSNAYIYCDLAFGRLGEDKESFNIEFSPGNVRGDVIFTEIGHSGAIVVRRRAASLDTDNNNNQMVFQVDLKNDSDDSPFQLIQGAAPVRQRKSKGSRNMFVKASKRGTSVRTI